MLVFRVKRLIRLGAKSLWMHRLRSILTSLGIIFGVCSVIAMLAIGEGASREAQEQIARLGSRNIIVKTVAPPEEQSASGQDSDRVSVFGLTYDDAERFRNTIPDVEVVVPVRRIMQQAWYRNRRVAIEVIGSIPWYPEISPVELKQGRFLSSIDMHYKRGICVVDESVINRLFVVDEPLGRHVKIKDNYYNVVGVVSSAGPVELEPSMPIGHPEPGTTGGGVEGNIYIPLTTFKAVFGELSAQFSGGRESIQKVELQEIIVKVTSMEQVLTTRDILDSLLSRFHEKKDYQIVVPLELLRQAARTKRIFSIVLGSIAAISLLVGGIGIMNIMLATVTERTREIGIRRALGARRRDIVVQFLSETVMLTLTGGLVGIVLGSLIPYLVTRFVNMPTVVTGISLVLSFGISALIGITFGIYPAYRAANMDPIESLRHE
jgi:putative ABC transport system permease protein